MSLHSIGFRSTSSDSSLFVYCYGQQMAYLLLYVDDIVLTASTTSLLQQIVPHLGRQFAMKDLAWTAALLPRYPCAAFQ